MVRKRRCVTFGTELRPAANRRFKSAIRPLAVAATDNELLAPETAAGIARVKSAKSIGVRSGKLAHPPAGPGAS
jgi:ribosomal protein L4